MQQRLRQLLDGSDITEGSIWRKMFLYFLPILLGGFFQQLYNTADAIIVGRYVGKEALAAVGGATGEMMNLLVGFFIGLSAGATVIISQHYGARRHREVGESVHTAYAMALAAGLILTVTGLMLSPLLLQMMNTPADVYPYALTYAHVVFSGMVPSLVYNMGAGILRAVGDSRRPLYFLVVSCVVNILLDLLLVAVFPLGVLGAGIATVISQWISAALVTIALIETDYSYRLTLRKIRFHLEHLKRMVAIGLPAAIQAVLYSLSNVTIQTTINGFGTDVVAGWTAYTKVSNIFWMTINAMGTTVTTFTGQHFGARLYKRMFGCIRVGASLAVILVGFMSGFILLSGKNLLQMFTEDPEVIRQGVTIMWQMAPYYFLFIGIEVISASLRGAGDAIMPMVITFLGVCAFRLVWVLIIAPPYNSFLFALLCYPVSWAMTSLAFVLYFFTSPWMKRCIRKAGGNVEAA